MRTLWNPVILRFSLRPPAQWGIQIFNNKLLALVKPRFLFNSNDILFCTLSFNGTQVKHGCGLPSQSWFFFVPMHIKELKDTLSYTFYRHQTLHSNYVTTMVALSYSILTARLPCYYSITIVGYLLQKLKLHMPGIVILCLLALILRMLVRFSQGSCSHTTYKLQANILVYFFYEYNLEQTKVWDRSSKIFITFTKAGTPVMNYLLYFPINVTFKELRLQCACAYNIYFIHTADYNSFNDSYFPVVLMKCQYVGLNVTVQYTAPFSTILQHFWHFGWFREAEWGLELTPLFLLVCLIWDW